MIKRAIGYVRISTKDQSNFSLDGQEEYIRKHCQRQNWELIGISRDEGESAKNFDRPDWKDLHKYIKNNHKKIDYLVVLKYDRFSRNTAEALTMLQELEEKYNIRVMSVMEPIGLPPESPIFFQIRTMMLVGAETELRVIKDRTSFGIVNAKRSGRYIGIAPWGYINAKDEKKKPIILVDKDRAPLVVEAFNLFASGVSIAEVSRIMSAKGLNLKGKSAYQRMFSQPAYTGLIQVPAYQNEPEEMVEGMHQAIVDRATWWRVQHILTGRNKVRVVYNEEVPLRGVVNCFCHKPLTAGNSKGRSQYYWYYKCNSHPEINLKAPVLHSQFDEILKELSYDEEAIEYLKSEALRMMNEKLKAKKEAIARKKREIEAISAKIKKLEGKFIDDDIEPATYREWRNDFENQRHKLENEVYNLEDPLNDTWKRYYDVMDKLADLQLLYNVADIHGKQSFIRTVFNSNLYYQDGCYRTTYIIPMFAMKAASLAQKRLLIIEQPFKISGKIPACSEDGS